MRHKLVIAEKPSVGAEIASVLGAKENKKNYREGNGYIVTWCIGHLAEFAKPDAYDEKYKNWKIADLPIIPEKIKFEVLPKTKYQYRIICKLLEREDVDEIICATDAGREGECIFRYVYMLSGCRKPVKRLWVSSVEHSEIEKGFDNLKPDSEYNDLFIAGFSRAKADWLFGINFSRLFSCLYNEKITIGRVQTPTLNILVQREEEIRTFQPKKFYNIVMTFDGMTADSERYDDYYDALKQLAVCNRSPAYIKKADRQHKEVRPPKLFNLANLQKTANHLLGYTAKQTLDIAQALYEKGLITYPRTDSNYVGLSMRKKIVQLVPLSVHLMGMDMSLFNADNVVNDNKVSDHHAILPTDEISSREKTAKLLPSQMNLLRIICSRLLSAVSSSHTYEQTDLTISCGEIDFTARGNKVISTGFKTVQNDCIEMITGTPVKEEENILPDILAEGLVLEKTCEVQEHTTIAPKHYTDASLISAMENAGSDDEHKGIGTQATQAGIIEKIIRNGYAERMGKNIVPTDKGIALINSIPEKIKSANMTAEWENKLKQIENGEYSAEAYMSGIEMFITDTVNEYKSRSPLANEKGAA